MWTLIWAFAIGIMFRLGWKFADYGIEAMHAMADGFATGWERERE